MQALEQVASRQGEADRLRTEAANLRAEKEQWKVSWHVESRSPAEIIAQIEGAYIFQAEVPEVNKR